MTLDIDIYNSSERFERALGILNKSTEFNKKDIEDITNFVNEMGALGIKTIRLNKQVYVLRGLARLKNKPFRKCDKTDLVELVRKIEANKSHAAWTKYDQKVVLKKFYKWMHNTEDEYPACIKWLKVKEPRNKILPEDILTEEEVIKLIETARTTRDKAFISTLYESGCRIGELLTLQIKNVTFSKYLTSIIVNGKTGQRRIPLLTSTTSLSRWLEEHPFKDNREAPLWVILWGDISKSEPKVMSYSRIKKMIRGLFKKADIKKRTNPHIFRHSRATALSLKLKESQLDQYMGWVYGSKMPSRYIHLSGESMDSTILEMHGIKTPEHKETRFTQIACPRCTTINPAHNRLCHQCGGAITTKTALEIQQDAKLKALDFTQAAIDNSEHLEKEGVDMKTFNKFMKKMVDKLERTRQDPEKAM
ncbi:MAG: site-specific integrase [Candidatus Diapherotrites archaeon]